MVENEVIELQIVGTIKLLVSAYLLFYWIPKRVLPQEYIDNPLDRVMFNIIHAVAIITLLFPLFVYIRIFGFLFIVMFFVALRLLFLRFYYRKNVYDHLRSVYIVLVTETLKFLERPGAYFTLFRKYLDRKLAAAKNRTTPAAILYWTTFFTIVVYSLFLRVYRGYISLVGAVPDMYQFYYWGNILKMNILFDKTAGAPYMWAGPVLVYTINQFAQLNTVVIHNIFPILFLSFMFFAIFYVLRKFFESEGKQTASMFGALILFGIILPSPLAQKFFGLLIATTRPEVLKVSPFSFYYPPVLNLQTDQISTLFPAIFFWRFTAALPYEMASSFFLINLYFLIKFIESKKNIYLLLYAETLGIVFSIHGGVAIPLLVSSLLIFVFALLAVKTDFRSLLKMAAAIMIAAFVGNLWLLQFFVYRLPGGLGAAAPLLDKIVKTGSASIAVGANRLLLLTAPPFLLSLIAASFILFGVTVFTKRLRFRLMSLALVSIGVLLIYFAPNLGLPRIVDQSRMMVFVAYSYAVVFAIFYYLVVERIILKSIFKRTYFIASTFLVFSATIFAIAYSPRWIDTKMFWDNIHGIEYNEFPYLVYKIEDNFQPFSYTIVSYVQEFPQVITKGYHLNTQDLLQTYDPAEKIIRIPTDYVFIFMENIPITYQGMGEYWYRWRPDIMLKLKDWVAIYSQYHNNIKEWYSDEWVDVYLIDNRSSEKSLLRQRESMKDTGR
jgi:hypothetical protein